MSRPVSFSFDLRSSLYLYRVGSDECGPTYLPKRIPNGSGSCNITSNNIAEGVSPCKLYVSSSLLLLIARGKVYIQIDTLHNRSLPHGNVKVSVDVVVESNAQLQIPNHDDKIMAIAQAIGTFVAWPINLIQVDDMVAKSIKRKEMEKEALQQRDDMRKEMKKEAFGKEIIWYLQSKLVLPNDNAFLFLSSQVTTDTLLKNRVIDKLVLAPFNTR
ncbi:hypothetical protein JHK85_025420 [Glycine max]|nr:hypothetical protein JHK85_025420 [Glycine max]